MFKCKSIKPLKNSVIPRTAPEQRSSKSQTRKNSQQIKRYPQGNPQPKDPIGQHLSELFPNGWDWIYSPTPEGHDGIDWQTIKAFPLTPSQMWEYHQDSDCLIRYPSQRSNPLDRHRFGSPLPPSPRPKLRQSSPKSVTPSKISAFAESRSTKAAIAAACIFTALYPKRSVASGSPSPSNTP